MPQDKAPLSSTDTDTHTICMPDAEVMESIAEMSESDVIRLTESEKVTTRDKFATLVVCLYGGPGCGKSTIAAGIFFELKCFGINCEIAPEFCKDLVWEERRKTFTDQIYIFGKQYHRIQRLLGKVSVIITDNPILLTPVYDYEKRPTFEKLVVEEHNKMWTYNAFIERKKAFNPKGRNHNEDEAKLLDCAIADILWKHNVPFETFDGTAEGKDAIVKNILMLLEWKNKGE